MADSKVYTSAELVGHRIGITRPGPDYHVIVTDMESGLVISNVTGFLVTWDGHTLRASLSLDDSAVQVEVHDMFTVTDSLPQEQDEHTTSIQVPVSVPFSASEVASEPLSSSEVTTDVSPEKEHNGDTEPELPAIELEQEVS